MSNLPKMRFPQQALEELRRLDPETPIKVNYIRKLIKTDTIPYVKIGNRCLINFDAFLDYLAAPHPEVPQPTTLGIRRIEEKL